MYEYMTGLYQHYFAAPPSFTALEQEAEHLHKQLSAQMDQPLKASLLRLIDLEAELRDDASLYAFISGFQLAWGIQQELLSARSGDRCTQIEACRPDTL